jgi:hypothetical protein
MVLKDIRECPTYVINLDRRPDRWQTFLQQPALNEFKQLQRFSAVDGAKLNIPQDERVSLHTRHNIAKKFRRSHYEICTPGAIGASLSHISIWKKFLESDSEYVVVFEDDTLVKDEYLKKIDVLVNYLPEDWDMWLLGTHRWSFKGDPLSSNDRKSWWGVKEFTGAHSYVLSRRGAKILLDDPFPIETHIEYYICGCSYFKGLKIIKHWALRMGYAAELTQEADSDTFDTMKSCPLCYLPDNYSDYGLYISYDRLVRILIGVSALGFVGYGYYKSRQR